MCCESRVGAIGYVHAANAAARSSGLHSAGRAAPRHPTRLGEFFAQHPLVLGPIFTEPSVEPGLESRDPAGHARVTNAMRLCSATSFVGMPAVAVHAGVFDGLPQGVQVIAGMYREDLCLAAAQAIEQRIGIATPIDPT